MFPCERCFLRSYMASNLLIVAMGDRENPQKTSCIYPITEPIYHKWKPFKYCMIIIIIIIAPDAVTLTKDGDLSFFAKQDEVSLSDQWSIYTKLIHAVMRQLNHFQCLMTLNSAVSSLQDFGTRTKVELTLLTCFFVILLLCAQWCESTFVVGLRWDFHVHLMISK